MTAKDEFPVLPSQKPQSQASPIVDLDTQGLQDLETRLDARDSQMEHDMAEPTQPPPPPRRPKTPSPRASEFEDIDQVTPYTAMQKQREAESLRVQIQARWKKHTLLSDNIAYHTAEFSWYWVEDFLKRLHQVDEVIEERLVVDTLEFLMRGMKFVFSPELTDKTADRINAALVEHRPAKGATRERFTLNLNLLIRQLPDPHQPQAQIPASSQAPQSSQRGGKKLTDPTRISVDHEQAAVTVKDITDKWSCKVGVYPNYPGKSSKSTGYCWYNTTKADIADNHFPVNTAAMTVWIHAIQGGRATLYRPEEKHLLKLAQEKYSQKKRGGARSKGKGKAK